MTNGTNAFSTARRLTGLALLAGLAVGLGAATDAEAISVIKFRTNYDSWENVEVPVRDDMGNIVGFENRAITGQGITIGMVEAAQPNLQHIAFEGLNSRTIWYPFEDADSRDVSTVRRDLFPTTPQGSLRFPVDLHRHATAVAGAMVGRNENLFGRIETFGPLTGIAPDASLLTGALITEVIVENGQFRGVTNEAILFTLAAMTDVDFDGDGTGDFIEPLAEWYGVEPWDPADVINISFGRLGSIGDPGPRSGEDPFSRIANVMVWRTNTPIVAAVGDNAQNPVIEEIEDTEGGPQGSTVSPAAAHNTIAVGRTGTGDDIDGRDPDSGFGQVPIFNWVSREGDFYLQNPVTEEDYEDINLMGNEDPREQEEILFPEGDGNDSGLRIAIDLVAPGTLIQLPASPLNGPFFLSNVDTWEGWEGSSFASAIVTGAVALMQEYGREWGFSTDPVLLRAVLMNSAEKPQGWSNGAQPDPNDPLVGPTTNEALDEEIGTGVLDFQRLLLQYRATPEGGGYRDLTPATSEFLAAFRPVFRRDPDIESPSAGEPGTQDYVPNVSPLRSRNSYFQRDPDFPALNEEYFFTSPDFATVTAYRDPTAGTSGFRSAPSTQSDEGAGFADALWEGEDGNGSGDWRNFAQPIGTDRYGFLPGGGSRFGVGGNTGSGGRFGVGSGVGGGGALPGGGDSGSGDPTQDNSLRPCTSLGQTRCIRAGWDIGRIGVGFLDIPIGLLPDDTEVIATLVWNRTEDFSDEAFERILDGVLAADPPTASGISTIPTTDGLEPANVAGPQPLMALDPTGAIDSVGPAPRVEPKLRGFPSIDLPGQTVYPYLMSGVTLRGPGPDFEDLDRDKDGANDAAMNFLDTCFIDPGDLLAITQSGLPQQLQSDSYDPLQTDLDGDGCGPPCDPDDALAGAIGPEGTCFPNASTGPTTFFDSERLRRITDDFYTTPLDEENVDPLAFTGVVGLRLQDSDGNFSFATGVLLTDRRILTAAHVFDLDNDGQSEINPSDVDIFFPTFARNTAVVQYTSEDVGGAQIDIHPSFNYIGDRNDMDPLGMVQENARDDIAILTVRGESLIDFVDRANLFGALPYDGSQVQLYSILNDPVPDAGTRQIVMAGYGGSGDGRFGVPVDASAPDAELPPGYVPPALNTSGPPSPVFRYGRNVVDFYPNLVDDDTPASTLTETFFFDFDDPDNPTIGGLGGGSLGNRIETMITPGDSGSPAFFHNDINVDGNIDAGELQLFGINTNNVVAEGVAPSSFGSNGQGMVLNAYTGTGPDGNFRFIDAILNEVPPMPPGELPFNTERGQFEDLVAFKFDNLDLELRRQRFDGGDDQVVIRSAANSNVEHIYAQSLEDFGSYYLRISWAGPQFDWGGFQFQGEVPFRVVPPVNDDNNDLNIDDIQDFFPAEVKYGLAWWADIPFDRIFEISVDGAGRSTGTDYMGDMNGDFAVNATDIAMLLARWNTPGPIGDLSGDGTVDAADLLILLRNFGS